MTQWDIIKFLYEKRKEGRSFFSSKEISEAMDVRPQAVRQQISRLLVYGYLDKRVEKRKSFFSQGPYKRRYRLKDEYMEKAAAMVGVESSDSISVSSVDSQPLTH